MNIHSLKPNTGEYLEEPDLIYSFWEYKQYICLHNVPFILLYKQNVTVTYIIKGKPTIGPTHSIPSYLTQKIRNHMFKQRPVHNIYRSFLWVSQNLERGGKNLVMNYVSDFQFICEAASCLAGRLSNIEHNIRIFRCWTNAAV